MGPSNSAPAQINPKKTLSEQDYLRESEKFILENQICGKNDESFSWVQLIVAKLSIYGHKNLLEHLRRCLTNQAKMSYLDEWRSIPFQHLDHLFQNLIKAKVMKSQDEQVFTKISTHLKHSPNKQQEIIRISQRGQDVIRKKKVAVIIFVGSSSTKGEEIFDKQFYRQSKADQCLFEIIMQRLEAIGDKYEFPSTYLFYNQRQTDKISAFMKKFKYGGKIQCCVQSTQPVLNLNGNLCLKQKGSAEVVEMPNGSGDFYNTSIKGMGILQKMKMDGIEFVSCCDCENMLESVLDPYMVGLFDANKQDYDLMYKCTYPQNQKETIFRRVVLQNGALKADTVDDLTALVSYNKSRQQYIQNIRQSPVWMNSVIFKPQSLLRVIGSADSMSIFPQAVNCKIKTMSYWSPLDVQMRSNESCYVFQKQLCDLLINSLFKSKGIMVDRDEEYLPVITENKEFSWKEAYREYKRKQQKKLLIPLHERLLIPGMMQSVIRSDEYDHKRPN